MVLALGAGAVPRAFLESGLSPDRLVVVELDFHLCHHLRETLPGVMVIEGDARRLPELLPAGLHGRFGSVICGIRLAPLAVTEQQRFTGAMASVAPNRGFLHYSCRPTSPLSCRTLGLRSTRHAYTLLSFPPASLWHYALTD